LRERPRPDPLRDNRLVDRPEDGDVSSLELSCERDERPPFDMPSPCMLLSIMFRGRSAPIMTPSPSPTAPKMRGLASVMLGSDGDGRCKFFAIRGRALVVSSAHSPASFIMRLARRLSEDVPSLMLEPRPDRL